jgi:DNA-binding response OmpR family regulator
MTQPRRETRGVRDAGGLQPGPHVAGHRIQRDEAQHALVIDQTLIACTPTEYQVLALLLEQANQCVPYAQFLTLMQETQLTEAAQIKQARIRLMHLMSDLRAKIWPLGLDIVAVMNTGYLLLSSRAEVQSASPAGRVQTREASEEQRESRHMQA